MWKGSFRIFEEFCEDLEQLPSLRFLTPLFNFPNFHKQCKLELAQNMQFLYFSGDCSQNVKLTRARKHCERYNLAQKQLNEMSDLIQVDR